MDAPAGTVVAVRDPALVRSVVAVEAGTTVLAVGCARLFPDELAARALRGARPPPGGRGVDR